MKKSLLLVFVVLVSPAIRVLAEEAPPVIRIEHTIKAHEVSPRNEHSYQPYKITIKNDLISTNDLITLYVVHQDGGILFPLSDNRGYRDIRIQSGQVVLRWGNPTWVEIPGRKDNPVGSKIVIFIVKSTQHLEE